MKTWFFELFSNSLFIGKVLLLVGVPTCLLVVHVYNQHRLAEVGYQIAEATAEHQQLLEENKKLTVEARLQGRSDRVKEVAEQQFGLEPLSPAQVVIVDEQESEEPAGEHARLDDEAALVQ